MRLQRLLNVELLHCIIILGATDISIQVLGLDFKFGRHNHIACLGPQARFRWRRELQRRQIDRLRLLRHRRPSRTSDNFKLWDREKAPLPIPRFSSQRHYPRRARPIDALNGSGAIFPRERVRGVSLNLGLKMTAHNAIPHVVLGDFYKFTVLNGKHQRGCTA